MGSILSAPFNHPDLLVTFACNPVLNCNSQEWYRCNSSGCCIGQTYGCFGFSCGHATDPGWVRNSPLRIELVDLLTDALKAMGGWPSLSGCCFGQYLCAHVPPQLVLALNKVCKKFNDAKLFDMGLQCRAFVSPYKKWGNDQWFDCWQLFVLVEKRSDEKLRDVGDPLGCLKAITAGNDYLTQNPLGDPRPKYGLAWSPPEDWMTRLSPPYNEATNHV